MSFVDSNFLTKSRLFLMRSGRSPNPKTAANRAKAPSNNIASRYSLPEYPAIAARSAVIPWVAGKYGEIDRKKSGRIAKGKDPPAPVICKTRNSTPKAFPALPKVAMKV